MAAVQVQSTKPHAKSVPISTTAYQLQYEQQLLAQQSKRASTRLSTYSITPTLTPSIAPSHLSHESNSSVAKEKADPLSRDVSTVQATLSRLNEPRLTSQRYTVSEAKKEEIGKLALGAKLERALGRRMSKQDAAFTKGKAKDLSSDGSAARLSVEASAA